MIQIITVGEKESEKFQIVNIYPFDVTLTKENVDRAFMTLPGEGKTPEEIMHWRKKGYVIFFMTQ